MNIIIITLAYIALGTMIVTTAYRRILPWYAHCKDDGPALHAASASLALLFIISWVAMLFVTGTDLALRATQSFKLLMICFSGLSLIGVAEEYYNRRFSKTLDG
jgi:hypothetical protein